jgi:hypothetical protein
MLSTHIALAFAAIRRQGFSAERRWVPDVRIDALGWQSPPRAVGGDNHAKRWLTVQCGRRMSKAYREPVFRRRSPPEREPL